MSKGKVFFITATDTGVGKTVAIAVLATLLQAQGHELGVLKPVQCAGQDAQFLKKFLELQDDKALINPFYAPEPVSPHLAFRRSRIRFVQQRVLDCLKVLQAKHDIVLVEGAGGLMAPITDSYYNADLIADLKAEVIIVARLGLGTINHSLLTINEAKIRGLRIKGLIFCQSKPAKQGLAESTNPTEIEKLSGVKVLGIIPYLKPFDQKNILKQCKNLKLSI